jgi:hypothetical protein
MNTYQRVYKERRKTGEKVKDICKRLHLDYKAYLSERAAFAGSHSDKGLRKKKQVKSSAAVEMPVSTGGGKVVVMIGTIDQVRELLQ